MDGGSEDPQLPHLVHDLPGLLFTEAVSYVDGGTEDPQLPHLVHDPQPMVCYLQKLYLTWMVGPRTPSSPISFMIYGPGLLITEAVS